VIRAIVTAGGTREPIDDVRVVANRSRGWFGCAIARALLERGVATTLIAAEDLATERIPVGARVVRFGSFAELDAALTRELHDSVPDLLFMAAAVADYSPERTRGKIRSDADELVIRMKRNPKLLASLRERCGPSTVLVGFKLLSGVSRAELALVGQRQREVDALDLTVANDLKELTGDRHPVVLCSRDGIARVDATRDESARQIAAFALKRFDVAPPEPVRFERALVVPSRRLTSPVAIATAEGGAVVSVEAGGGDRIAAEWRAMQALAGESGIPILADGGVVGAWIDDAVFVAPALRGRGLGDRIALELDRRGARVRRSEADAWWIERGWRIAGESLEPPSSRTDLVAAASACWFDPIRSRVLIGRRKVGAWPGWWAFPGGKREPGESAVEAAARELAEETGFSLPHVAPSWELAVAVGTPERAFEVANVGIVAPSAGEPAETDELAAAWISIDEAARLRPMAAGTRRILRHLTERVG
jgi:8-oxo-dGTP pyrophosphatase MutT (NUDIX family)